VKQPWTGRLAQAAGKYGEIAPQAAVCCNACRTCMTTNAVGIAVTGVAAAGVAFTKVARTIAGR
jgi:hypothetical protein